MKMRAYEMIAELSENMDELERAAQFWSNARNRVITIAKNEQLQITVEEHDDPFLYDLYDNGDYIPSDDEIVVAIKEANAG